MLISVGVFVVVCAAWSLSFIFTLPPTVCLSDCPEGYSSSLTIRDIGNEVVSCPTLQHVVCKFLPLTTSIFFSIRLVCQIERGKFVASGPCRLRRTGGQALKCFSCIDLKNYVNESLCSC